MCAAKDRAIESLEAVAIPREATLRDVLRIITREAA